MVDYGDVPTSISKFTNIMEPKEVYSSEKIMGTIHHE